MASASVDPPGAGTYATDLVSALRDISSNQEVADSLSFAGTVTKDVLSYAITNLVGDLSAAKTLGTQALTSAIAIGSDTLVSMAEEIGGAVNVIANAVPILGSIVGVISLAGSHPASGAGFNSNDPAVVQATCQADFRPVVHGATLSSANIVPADIFAVKDIPDTSYESGGISTLGMVLVEITESNPLVPPKNRQIFQKLRRAIEGQYLAKGSDGGAAIWPLYVDMLWSEWMQWPSDAWKTVHALMIRDVYFPITFSPEGEECAVGDHGAYAGCSCFAYERRGYDQVMALVSAWDSRVRPVYSQEIEAAKDVQAMLNRAKLMIAIQTRGIHPGDKKPSGIAQLGLLGALGYGIWRWGR